MTIIAKLLIINKLLFACKRKYGDHANIEGLCSTDLMFKIQE
jgi:hypothetical protein